MDARCPTIKSAPSSIGSSARSIAARNAGSSGSARLTLRDFSKVQDEIYRLIRQEVPGGDAVINSTPPDPICSRKKTGGDGVHYNRESGEAWARKVIDQCDSLLPRRARKVAAVLNKAARAVIPSEAKRSRGIPMLDL
jgi:hypothetical protein